MEDKKQLSVFDSLLRVFVVNAESARRNEEALASKEKVLVGGGTGFIGTELCKTLKKKGYNPVVVSRTAGASKITYDQLKNEGIPDNTKAVVNLAGQNILEYFHRWTDTFKNLVYDSRINTATAFREAIEKCEAQKRPKVFIQITGVGYYPYSDSVVYNEDSKVKPDELNFFGRLVHDWEAAATLPKDLGVRNVFVRSGVVLGRNGGMIKQIFLPFYVGGGGRMGSGTQHFPWIHVKDLSGIVIHAIENENVSGVLNGVAPQIITNQEFVDSFARALYRPAFFPLPDTVWNLAFGQERATMITKGLMAVPKRTLDSGYEFRFPTITKACEEFSQLFYRDLDDN